MKMELVCAVPDGNQKGIITQCHETSKSFDGGRTQETVFEVVIQPEYALKGHRTLPVSVVFSHSLTSLSGMGRFLGRINAVPSDGQEFVPASIEGTEVAFTVNRKDDGFVVVAKDTIRAAK